MGKRIRSLVLLGAIAVAVSGAVVTASATAQPPSTQGGGTFEFVNRHSGKCLEIAFEGTADFSGANQYQCTGRASQHWQMIFSPNPVDLRNQNSGKCLEIAFEGLWDFNAANQYQCTWADNQVWDMRQVQ